MKKISFAPICKGKVNSAVVRDNSDVDDAVWICQETNRKGMTILFNFGEKLVGRKFLMENGMTGYEYLKVVNAIKKSHDEPKVLEIKSILPQTRMKSNKLDFSRRSVCLFNNQSNRSEVEKILDYAWKTYYNPNNDTYSENSEYFGHKPSKVRLQHSIEGFIQALKKGTNTFCDMYDKDPKYEDTTAYWVMKMCRELGITMEFQSFVDKEAFEQTAVHKFELDMTSKVQTV